MSIIDVSKWHKLDVWRHPDSDGDACVRPGLRRIYTPAAGYTLVAGFSIRDEFVDSAEVWHYLVTKHQTSGVHLLIVDENFDTFQDFTWATDGDPRVVTAAVVEGMIYISSPDLPPLFGEVGSGIETAIAVPQEGDTGQTVINPPRGICTVFCNRVAVANGRSLFFSDPVAADGGDIRTFVGFNQNQRPGIIYGLHEGAGGMLVAVTSEGVYGLDVDAAAVAVVGSNGTPWRLLSHISAHSYASSCVHRGRIYVLTQDGWAPGDTDDTDQVFLNDPTMPRARGPAISVRDFRRCSMFAMDDGPLVAAPQVGAFHRTDITRGTLAWWRDQTDAPGDVRGVLRDHWGSELLVMSDGVYVIGGDFDGEVALSSGVNTQPVGVIFGTLDAAASDNMLPRRISHAAAVDGDEAIYIAVRGSEHDETPDADPMGLTADMSAWGATGRRYTSTPIAAVEIDFGDIVDTAPTRDVGIELGASGCLTRINTRPDLSLSESASKRAQRKG